MCSLTKKEVKCQNVKLESRRTYLLRYLDYKAKYFALEDRRHVILGSRVD